MKPQSLIRCLLLLFLCLPFAVFPAINNLPSNTEAGSAYAIDSDDTLVSSRQMGGLCGTTKYSLDIDQNGISDFTFTLYCAQGSSGLWAKIQLSSADNSAFSVDTAIVDSVPEFDSLARFKAYVPKNFSMVRMYELNDVIDVNNCNDTSNMFISNWYSTNYNTHIIYRSLDNWISGEHYIGFSKTIASVKYSGWIRIEVLDYYSIIIKDYAMKKGSTVAIVELDAAPVSVYPNPADDKICLDLHKNPAGELRIYSLNGAWGNYALIEGKNWVDVSFLASGIYLFEIIAGGKRFTEKILIK